MLVQPRPSHYPFSLNPADNTLPPTDMEMAFNQKVAQDHAQSEAELTAQEQQRYQDSLDKIEAQLGTERLNLQACWSVYGDHSKQCWELLKGTNGYCITDVVLDSRGDHHQKEFCGKVFLDYHNPAIKR